MCRNCLSLYIRTNKHCFICKQEIQGNEDIKNDK